ncbi:MAG: hypothetical protein ACE5JG_12585, partial [Planctomycetota bacterium]
MRHDGDRGGHLVHDIPEDRISDPREEEGWFRRLPEGAKRELRDRWRTDEGRLSTIQGRWRARNVRYVVEGVGLLVVFEVLFGQATPLSFGAAAGVGAVMGLVCAALRAGRESYLVAGVAAHCLLGLIAYGRAFHLGLLQYVAYGALCLLPIDDIRQSLGY